MKRERERPLIQRQAYVSILKFELYGRHLQNILIFKYSSLILNDFLLTICREIRIYGDSAGKYNIWHMSFSPLLFQKKLQKNGKYHSFVTWQVHYKFQS